MNTEKLNELVSEHHARTFALEAEEETRRQDRVREALKNCRKRWNELLSEEFREALEEAGFTFEPKTGQEYTYISVKRLGGDNEMQIAPSFSGQSVNWFKGYPWSYPSFTYDLSSREGELKLAAEIYFQFKV
jgi:hypothetical protein